MTHQKSRPPMHNVSESEKKVASDGKTPFLAIISTPIGNLEDITLRAIETLKKSDLVAAEDTRRAKILLGKYGINTKLVSLHAHNEHWKAAEIVKHVKNGQNVAVLSDAGTPSISDPGYMIVNKALEAGIEPLIIPGVSALTFAVTACSLPVDKFCFLGFLPVKESKRKAVLEKIAAEKITFFVFESPHRIEKLLHEINEIIGQETRVGIVREATKIHEEIIRGTPSEILSNRHGRPWKGECTVAICPQKS